MKIRETIGIDLSKLKFDAHIHSSQAFSEFANCKSGIIKMLTWVSQHSSFSTQETLFVFEHTGLYSYELSHYLSKHDLAFCIVPGLQIKRSLGIVRGKNDKVDAANISLYGYRLREELRPTQLPSQELSKLKGLLGLRERLVKQRSGYKSSVGEQKRILKRKDHKALFEVQERLIHTLSKQITRIDKEIESLIFSVEEMGKVYKLLLSIKGVGRQTAQYVIVYTVLFQKFKTARKFASYCGIAPFPNRSGSSQFGKTKVSPLANKKIKSLLELCARSAIQHNVEMKKYYRRKLAEGKNKTSVLNAIRNKLLARIYAVAKRETPYVELAKYAA